MTILIKNGRVIDPANGIDGYRDVLAADGYIARVDTAIDVMADKVIDAAAMWVVPGLIDMHVHFRQPGFEYKETIKTGSRAAAKGGFTTVCVMANTNPVIDSAEMVKWIVGKAAKDACVNVLPVGAVTAGLNGAELTDMAAMKAAGAAAFSDDGKYIANSAVMKAALIRAKSLGMPILAHCEDLRLKGEMAEVVAVERDIMLAESTETDIHICHISTAGGVEAVREAQKRGVNVTAEAAPHHFTHYDTVIPKKNTNYKMSPPIRKSDGYEAVREGLKTGVIGVIATDHAPHTPEEKALPYNDAPNGVIGLETALPLSIRLLRDGVLTRLGLIEKMTLNPARILGIGKGTLSVGAEADITIINPEKRYKINIGALESKCRNIAFNTRRGDVYGSVEYTVVAGKTVIERRKFTDDYR
jgi:dihydroorotase